MSLNQKTRIDWADYTWNPVWGCTGTCPYCYARATAKRFGLQVAGRDDFAPTWIPKNFKRPFPRAPSRIFVNSMSDLADWKYSWLDLVASRIEKSPEHRFLFLSKRPWECSLFPSLPNTMLGYSVTNEDDLHRLGHAGRRWVSFLSIEPILSPMHLTSEWLPRWIIVGAETGNRCDRVVPGLAWLREIWGYCQANRIPLFFKESLRPLWPAGAYFPQEYPA